MLFRNRFMSFSPQTARALRERARDTLRGLASADAPVPGVHPPILHAWRATLTGWTPLATTEPAQQRLAEHAVDQLARLLATRDRHPDNPRNDPLRSGAPIEQTAAWPDEEREARFGPLMRAGAEAELAARVEAAFAERIARWEQDFVDAGLAELTAESRRRQLALGRIGRALGVGLELLGLGADWSAGFFSERALTALEETAHRLESSPALQEILLLLGRLEAEEAATHRRPSPARRPGRRQPSELRGVTLSGDLSRVTPAALAQLGATETEGLFMLSLAENRLMSWDLGGPSRTTTALAPRVQRRRGPLVLCIDTSASMDGAAEALAKAATLAALRLALRQGRACRLISFSSATDWRELELSRLPEALPELLEFLLGAFRGGTEPGAALYRLARAPQRPADVLLISDGAFEPEELAPGVAALKALGVRSFGLLIGPDERAHRFEGLDAAWSCPPSGAGLIRCLRALGDSQVT